MNLLVAGGPGEQVVPHAAVVPGDGPFADHVWVGWYDNASGNYDVAVQLLTPAGEPLLPGGGLLVSDHPQNSWVMDWSLAADADGNAHLAFADIRDGDSNIHAYRIAPDGSFPWGPDGVTLTDDADFKGPPSVTPTSDGQAVVAWMQSGGSSVLRMQRLSATGAPLLPAGGVVVSDPADASPAGNLLVSTDGGDVILAWVPTYSFSGDRQIKAQRFDALGAPVWPQTVWVMDDATVPMGRYFQMSPDGANGALICWDVAVGTAFDARVQRLDADGNELLVHNGVHPEMGGPAGQLEPSAVVDLATGEITMVYIDMNAAQSERGLHAQRFDAAGNRLWGSSGTILLPRDGDLESRPALTLVDGAVVGLVEQTPGGAHAQDLILGFRIDDDGHHAWAGAVPVGANPSDKGDLLAVTDGGATIGFWVDGRGGTPDLYAQNLNPDGTLGGTVTAVSRPALPAMVGAEPCWPNPFNPRTTIAFELPHRMPVSLTIHDARGRLVRELVTGTLPAGRHERTWEGTDARGRSLPSGVYHYRLATPGGLVSHGMTLLK